MPALHHALVFFSDGYTSSTKYTTKMIIGLMFIQAKQKTDIIVLQIARAVLLTKLTTNRTGNCPLS